MEDVISRRGRGDATHHQPRDDHDDHAPACEASRRITRSRRAIGSSHPRAVRSAGTPDTNTCCARRRPDAACGRGSRTRNRAHASVVDPVAPPLPAARDAAPAAEVLAHRRPRALEHAPQRRVIEGGERREGIDALEEEHLGFVDVADARDRLLSHQRHPDRHLAERAQARQRDLDRGVREQIDSEARELRHVGFAPREARDRQIETDHGPRVVLHHDGRARRGLAPRLTHPLHVPAPVHEQMRAQQEPVVERDDQVLATRSDVDHHATHARRGRRRAVEAHERTPDQRRVEPTCGAEDGVAFGHESAAWGRASRAANGLETSSITRPSAPCARGFSSMHRPARFHAANEPGMLRPWGSCITTRGASSCAMAAWSCSRDVAC